MRTRNPLDIASDVEDANFRLPIGTRVRTATNPSPGTVRWHPFVCDAGTVSVIVAWDNLPPERNTHYVRTRSLEVIDEAL
jgi:hypothetical protein